MSSVREMQELGRILEAGMRSLGLSGEITVRLGGSSSTRWVGQQAEGDLIVDVRVTQCRPVTADGVAE